MHALKKLEIEYIISNNIVFNEIIFSIQMNIT
jgi:hypothetical protein